MTSTEEITLAQVDAAKRLIADYAEQESRRGQAKARAAQVERERAHRTAQVAEHAERRAFVDGLLTLRAELTNTDDLALALVSKTPVLAADLDLRACRHCSRGRQHAFVACVRQGVEAAELGKNEGVDRVRRALTDLGACRRNSSGRLVTDGWASELCAVHHQLTEG